MCCDDCLFGLSKSTCKFIYKSNIENEIMDIYNTEYKLYNYGLSEYDNEPLLEDILNNTNLFRIFKYCPNCSNLNEL